MMTKTAHLLRITLTSFFIAASLILFIAASAQDIAAQTSPLVSAVCVDSITVPTHYRFTQNNVPYWMVVGVAPEPGDDKDIYLYTGPAWTGTLLAYSTAVDGSDFIVGDFNHTPYGTFYPTVTYGNNSIPYTVEWRSGGKILPLNHAFDVQIWGAVNDCFAFDVWDVYLEAGETYRFLIHFADLTTRLVLFRNPGTGTYWAGRDQAVFQVSGINTDGDYVAPASDWYGLVVCTVYRQPITAWARIEVRQLNTCVPLASKTCKSTIAYAFPDGPDDSHYFQQNVNWWSAVAVAPSVGDGKSVQLRSQCDYTASSDNILTESDPGTGQTALVVGDFNFADLPYTAYMTVDKGDPSAPYTIEWENGANFFPAKSMLSGSLGGTEGECNLVQIWDTYLETGKSHRVILTEGGAADIRFALFENPTINPYYAGRHQAFWELIDPGTLLGAVTHEDFFGLAIYANKRGEAGTYSLSLEELNDCVNIPTGTCMEAAGNVSDFFMGSLENSYWLAIGVLPSDEDDKDISVFTSCDGGGTLQGFSNGTQGADFVVSDWNHLAAQAEAGSLEPQANNFYPRVTYGSTTAPFTVSCDLGCEISEDLFPHNVVVPGEVGGVSGECGMLKIWDIYLQQGIQYQIGFARSGSADVRLALFRNPTNNRIWKGRAAREWELNGSQSISYTAPATDYYGLVVFANRRERLGSYTIRVSSGITGTGSGTPVPQAYSLYQNTPNPFNLMTEIRYDVPSDGGRVSLRIFDVTGRIVRTLVDGEQTPGTKTITWDALDDNKKTVAAGVYFYRLEAPGFSESRKAFVMK